MNVDLVASSGEAGDLGVWLIAFLQAELYPEIELVPNALKIDQYLPGCRLLFTVEGKLDLQSVQGKTLVGVARRAKMHNVPVIDLAGKIEGDLDLFHREGIDACFAIADGLLSLQESMNKDPQLLENKVTGSMRFWVLNTKK